MGNPPHVHRLKEVKPYSPVMGYQVRLSVCGRTFTDDRYLTTDPRRTQCAYCRLHQRGLRGLPRELPSAAANGSEKSRTYARRSAQPA